MNFVLQTINIILGNHQPIFQCDFFFRFAFHFSLFACDNNNCNNDNNDNNDDIDDDNTYFFEIIVIGFLLLKMYYFSSIFRFPLAFFVAFRNFFHL